MQIFWFNKNHHSRWLWLREFLSIWHFLVTEQKHSNINNLLIHDANRKGTRMQHSEKEIQWGYQSTTGARDAENQCKSCYTHNHWSAQTVASMSLQKWQVQGVNDRNQSSCWSWGENVASSWRVRFLLVAAAMNEALAQSPYKENSWERGSRRASCPFTPSGIRLSSCLSRSWHRMERNKLVLFPVFDVASLA